MRSGQQNKRGRGRSNNSNSHNNNNNGRKNGNPLSRSYDSNGPDVKIRGTAQHIADKYATMARDSLGSGDTVMAENYYQHAEHYYRIIATAQAQIQERQQRDERDNAEREQNAAEREQQSPERSHRSRDSEQSNSEPHAGSSPVVETIVAVNDGTGPQPVIEGTPAEVAIGEDAAPQPARRTPTRRRAPARPRRPRASAAVNGTDGDAAEKAPPAVPDAPQPVAESVEAKPEIVAAIPEV